MKWRGCGLPGRFKCHCEERECAGRSASQQAGSIINLPGRVIELVLNDHLHGGAGRNRDDLQNGWIKINISRQRRQSPERRTARVFPRQMYCPV